MPLTAPRVTVFLGAGGVGKTTLAAGYALALARAGRRVGLLGIDPSRRLQSALGLELSDHEAPVPDVPGCLAAVLAPAESLRRWAEESCDAEARARLFANPFFVALADHLAAATDVIAAVRVAEWAERDPSLTDLVVDTAPGINAIEFLRRPRHLAAFLEGDLVRWLRRATHAAPTWTTSEGLAGLASSMRAGARLVVGGLARVAGARLMLDFSEFLGSIERPAERMLARVADARRLVESGGHIVVVTTVRDDAAAMAAAIAGELEAIGLAPAATVVNRAVPLELARELADVDPATLSPGVAALARYARAYGATQARVLHAVGPLAPACLTIPATRGLDGSRRLDALAELGEPLEQLVRDARPHHEG